MNTTELLTKAREAISNPDNWIKGCYAKDDKGREVDTSNKAACKFCTYGAIYHTHEYTGEPREAIALLCQAVGEAKTGWDIVSFNDAPERTHDEVLSVFDRAIELSKEA